MEYPARLPFYSRTACPRSCSPLLRSPCGDRHTSLRACASYSRPFRERFHLKPLFGWHRHRLPQPFLRLRRFTDLHHLPLSGTGKRVSNSADMAHCLPFATTLSGRRNAATMPCFRSARATCPTRPEVRVPSELGLRRSLGCRSRCRVSPATRLAPRGLRSLGFPSRGVPVLLRVTPDPTAVPVSTCDLATSYPQTTLYRRG
jgi:hypothetical protein